MNEKLFRQMLNLLLSAAEDARDASKTTGHSIDADMWSAVAGNLDNARKRMKR